MAYEYELDIVIDSLDNALTTADFNTPLIIDKDSNPDSATLTFDYCTNLAEVVAAGFSAGSSVHGMAEAIWEQRPKLPRVAVFQPTDPITASLTALALVNNGWYYALTTSASTADATKIAGWINAEANNGNKKLGIFTVSATATATATLAGTMNNKRAALLYSEEPGEYPDGCWVGRCAREPAGSITWSYMTLRGPSPCEELTRLELDSLHNADANAYVQRYNRNITSRSRTTGGEWIDVIHSKDFLYYAMKERVVRLLMDSPKVPYDNRGIAMLTTEILSVIKDAAEAGMVAKDDDGNYMYSFSVPRYEDIPAEDRANRVLPDVYFDLWLVGAIEKFLVRGVVRI